MAKTKEKHLSKDEAIAQHQIQLETNRKRNKVKQELYPVLLASSKSVEDAKLLCQIISAGIRQEFNNAVRTKKVKELGLLDKLNQEESRYPFFKTVLEMFGEETIHNALDIIEGFPKHLDGCILEEMSTRELKDLKVEFLPDVPPHPTA